MLKKVFSRSGGANTQQPLSSESELQTKLQIIDHALC